MAGERPTNPAEAFSELVTQWERGVNAFANQLMGTEGFSQVMNDAQKAQLNAQRSFAQAMTQQLNAMNMPTRDDVVSLAESIQMLDRRLERIEDMLAKKNKSKKAADKKRPPRTKQPPADDSA